MSRHRMWGSAATMIVALCLLPCLAMVGAQQQQHTAFGATETESNDLTPNTGEQISARRFKRMYAMCPPRFFRIGNECYYISPNKQNWLDAHFECKDRNSKLAEPLKYEDKNLRKFLVKSNDKNYYWIGGNYNWQTDKWQWGYNGKDIGYQSFSQMVPGQDLKYHCAVLNPDLKYRWAAKLCTDKLNFICQHKMPFVNSNSRSKVYNRWNATFPNQLANEVEVVVADQPRSVRQKDYYSVGSTTSVNPTANLLNRIRSAKNSTRTVRTRPSRRRMSHRNRLLQPKNDYISNDVYRHPVVEYVRDPSNELNLVNGNGHRNGNGGSAFQRGFNVDIHRRKTHKKHNRVSEVKGDIRPHQHRHHLGEAPAMAAAAATTRTTTTTTTTAAPMTARVQKTPPTHAAVTLSQQYEKKKALRDKVRQRLALLTPEERESFYVERAKRKRAKKQKSTNETIP
ncbi:uncharacterized protein LOC129764515 isoform X2 [Toxorhynchites rutilus septentrionalis]|uniref:uncharacterized protein LOC129764515 isoform X2 n=1 Tax=Toxorhynchites rutilus septentrionalis TaxID=329112 RepID=UPI0024784847|nr:uncharacterized protein LOC129764515 isoform X2 [Toxorhynchites rutilus septentrionalis]